ncbi:MAG: 2-phosphosulfolactate phosphatase [Acidiferrobacterales bacterium]
MKKVHVLTHKEELDPTRLSDKTVVVLDVLFATSTMIAALQHGARDVIPALDETAARTEANQCSPDSYVLAGEKHRERIPDFAHYAPLALIEHGIAGKRVIYTTTNGTIALLQAAEAPRVYAAALLNATAITKHVRVNHVDGTVLILCAGSRGAMTLEDFYGAGLLVERFLTDSQTSWAPSDAAQAALRVYQKNDAYECLRRSRIGRIVEKDGLGEEVRFAAHVDVFTVVPVLTDGRLLRADQVDPNTNESGQGS